MVELLAGSNPLVVYRIVAPAVPQAKVTVTELVNVPAFGVTVGVVTVGTVVTTRQQGFSENWLFAPVQRIVKSFVLVFVGVPFSTPVLGFRTNPGGKVPLMMVHVYEGVPPLASSGVL